MVKLTGAGSSETYWAAEAHSESAVQELTLFANTPGFSITPVKGAMVTGAEYLVLINDGEGGTFISPGTLRLGRGAWRSDTFDLADLATEQAKVRDRLCPT